MIFNRIFLLVEGNHDELFIQNIIFPLFQHKYNELIIWQYSQKKKEKIRQLVSTINSKDNWFYLYFRDFNNALCITSKKQNIKRKCSLISEDCVIIVVKEIESWYLAGATEELLIKLNRNRIIQTTNHITKERFNEFIPKGLTKLEVLLLILKYYDIELARRRNNSLNYFLTKFVN